MKAIRNKIHAQLDLTAVRMFGVSERMNQILIENLAPGAWRAQPTGGVRSIVAIFTHIHNVRSKWIRLTAPHLKVPRLLHRAHCTQEQARVALAESAALCEAMLVEALGGGGKIIKSFRRDSWAKGWPVGVEMLCYMLSHEAHHRGQVCMLAHQLGFPFPPKVTSELWGWERLWKKI